jgi:hypothetical protein
MAINELLNCPHVMTWHDDDEPHAGTQRFFERGRDKILARYCDECKEAMSEELTGVLLSDGFECVQETEYAVMTPEQADQWEEQLAKSHVPYARHDLKGRSQA